MLLWKKRVDLQVVSFLLSGNSVAKPFTNVYKGALWSSGFSFFFLGGGLVLLVLQTPILSLTMLSGHTRSQRNMAVSCDQCEYAHMQAYVNSICSYQEKKISM